MMSSVWTLLLCYGVAMSAILGGIPVYDALRSEPVRSFSPPPSNTTTPAPVYTNTTMLDQACADAKCAPAKCVQSELSGITQCSACPTGFTLDPSTQHCVDTSECVQWPWCSTQHAVVLRSVQDSVVAMSPLFSNIPAGWANVTAAFVPSLGASNAEATVLLNSFYTAKRALLTRGVLLNPGRFWDDEEASTTSLEVYKSVLVPEYVSYVTTMKRKLCSPYTWQPSQGQCIPPVSL